MSQLERIDWIVEARTKNFIRFLEKLDKNKYRTDFEVSGSSNYAFNLVLKDPDTVLVNKLINKLRNEGIEYRRGSAGGGNQLRQPYLKGYVGEKYHLEFPETEHIHFYGFYIGNYPDLTYEEVDELCAVINSV